MSFPAFDNLIRLLATLPGIGQRSAQRIAFHLIRSDSFQVRQLADALNEIKRQIRFCSVCGGLTDQEVCTICEDPERNRSVLCIVEEPGDIFAIEKTGEFSGLYHVLMGALSPLDGIGVEELRIEELRERLLREPFEEIFVATNPTLEGDATAHYITTLVGETATGRDIRLTRISHGIPTGATIEYADPSALARSIKNRQNL